MPTKDTNNSGEATFDLTEGNYNVHVEETGYQDGSDSFSIGSNETITRTVTLQDAELATVSVRVTDGNTGNAISGASVSAGGDSATTNSSGTATLNVPGGSWELSASSGGYESNTMPFSVDYGESISLTIPLTPDVEPLRIDDFERSNIDPWVNTHAEGTSVITRTASALAPGSNRGMYIPAPASAQVFGGLDNFPQAGGGPNNNGAWEFYFRFEETGGTLDLVRLDFAAAQGGSQMRWQIQSNSIGLRVGSSSRLDFNLNTPQGATRIIRINEWYTNGFIDASILDGSGTVLDNQYTTLESSARTSGGMRVWSNYSTAGSIDNIRYID